MLVFRNEAGLSDRSSLAVPAQETLRQLSSPLAPPYQTRSSLVMCSPASLLRIKHAYAPVIAIIYFCEFANNIHLSRVVGRCYKTQYRMLLNDRAHSGLKRSLSTSASAKIGRQNDC
jgi:hypothetical protein